MEVFCYFAIRIIVILSNFECEKGVSGFISQPHFLNADHKFVNSCYGLNPDENKHDFILHFEPVSEERNYKQSYFDLL